MWVCAVELSGSVDRSLMFSSSSFVIRIANFGFVCAYFFLLVSLASYSDRFRGGAAGVGICYGGAIAQLSPILQKPLRLSFDPVCATHFGAEVRVVELQHRANGRESGRR